MRLPKRKSLVNETAEALKEWLGTRSVGDNLSGEIQLKARLGVGRNTLRLALQLLEEQGWISAPVNGRQRKIRQIQTQLEHPAFSRLPVTFLSPYLPIHRTTTLELERLRLRLAEQGRDLQFVSPDIFQLKNPGPRLKRLVAEHPSAAWILYVPSAAIQHWFDQEKIPTLLYGTPFPDVNLPFVVQDWGAAAFHAGVQLVRQGHRNIGILEYHERLPALLLQEENLKRALATAPEGGRLLVFKDDRSPPAVARSLEIVFKLKERPTALVLTRAAQLLTCLSWFASQRIRVPDDVSLISITEDSWFRELHPPVTHYLSDTAVVGRHVAQRAMELVATGRVTSKSFRLPLKYVSGATIGPPPRPQI